MYPEDTGHGESTCSEPCVNALLGKTPPTASASIRRASGRAHSAKKMPTELVKTLLQNASIVGRNIGEHRVFTPTILVIL